MVLNGPIEQSKSLYKPLEYFTNRKSLSTSVTVVYLPMTSLEGTFRWNNPMRGLPLLKFGLVWFVLDLGNNKLWLGLGEIWI